MAFYVLLSASFGGAWMLITNRLSLESFGVGFMLSLAVMVVLRPHTASLDWAKLPLQIWAAVVYVGLLLRDIILSGLDVTRRVLSPNMPLKLGVVAIPTQDDSTNQSLITALSADVITLTPGELVMDIKRIEGQDVMFVHCLDVDVTAANGTRVQAERLALLRRILGQEGVA